MKKRESRHLTRFAWACNSKFRVSTINSLFAEIQNHIFLSDSYNDPLSALEFDTPHSVRVSETFCELPYRRVYYVDAFDGAVSRSRGRPCVTYEVQRALKVCRLHFTSDASCVWWRVWRERGPPQRGELVGYKEFRMVPLSRRIKTD